MEVSGVTRWMWDTRGDAPRQLSRAMEDRTAAADAINLHYIYISIYAYRKYVGRTTDRRKQNQFLFSNN
jgi:hypothetical protein